MTEPEFSRPFRVDTIGDRPRSVSIEADEAEGAALARRFGLVAVERLEAEAALTRRGEEVSAVGRVRAAVVQSCVATGDPLPAEVDEPFDLLFRPQPESGSGEEEIELGESELDMVFYQGASIDLGEAAAETLSLALDPFPRSPDAGEALRKAGVRTEEEAKAESGPFAALRNLGSGRENRSGD